MADHWAEKYVGMPYDRATFDCVDLVRLVARCERGIVIDQPEDREWKGVSTGEAAVRGSFAAVRTANPIDGDVVLMRLVGQRRVLGSHVGIYALIGGAAWVLHCLDKMGALLVEERNLRRVGLERVGFYSWKQ